MKTTTGSQHSAQQADAELEAALQGASEAVTPKRRRVWPWILLAQAAVLVAGYFAVPWFTTHLFFDREAMAAEEAAVSERARAYRQHEEAERVRREIHEEHADPLKRQEREKRRREIVDQVNELQAIAERMREKRSEQLTRLMEAPAGEIPEGTETRLEEILKKFATVSDTIEANEKIKDREDYGQAADELLAGAEATRRKANQPTGLEPRDREAISERLTDTESALEELRETNRDSWSGDLGDELDDAQDMVNLLRGIPTRVQQAGQQKRQTEAWDQQQRNRLLDGIRHEVERIKQSHRGLLSQKSRSPEVGDLAEALDAMQQTTQEQKAEGQWDQDGLERAFGKLKTAADGVKGHIRDINELGNQSETNGLAGTLNNQQRQAESQRRQWQQLQSRQAGEAKKSDQTVAAVIDKAKAQWAKTRDTLAPEGRGAHEQAVGELIEKAKQQSARPAAGTPPPAEAGELKTEAGKLAEALGQLAGDDKSAQREAGEFKKTLEQLANEVGKHQQLARKHAGDHTNLGNKISSEWRNAQKQLDDKAARVSPALAQAKDGRPAAEARDPDLAKIRQGVDQLKAGTSEMEEAGGEEVPDLGDQLAARSKTLGAAHQDARTLHQKQRTMQNGVARDESERLDRNLENLARSLGKKGGEVESQIARNREAVERQQATLQQSLDGIRQAAAKAEKLDSSTAKEVAETLAPVPGSATELMKDQDGQKAFLERVAQAQEQASEWHAQASGQAPPRQQQMAEARQTLRELSEAMAEAGISRQNSDAASDLLDDPPPDMSELDPSDLEGAVAAAETLHERIESDFQDIRAAEIATRTGQSFEHMQRLADAFTSDASKIDVPDAGTEIDTVGDLKEYRKAMDKAVAETEGLTQNARTLQRQALGEDDPTLAKALQEARAKARGQGARSQSRSAVDVGRDPRGGKDRTPSNTWHQMTFEKTPVRTKLLDVEKIKAEALPGRRFTGDSPRQGWLYVDTWYVIGPWENYGKIDWSNVHSPEFEIDLARTYPGGKGGRELRWQFTQHPTIRCDVPDEQTNSSYYAYTEVYFDQPREMLVAIASNDAGKLWIDDQVIWEDNGLSIWNMDEGFRRVRFKKGFSKILMRVENGPRFCQFSMLLCPPDL